MASAPSRRSLRARPCVPRAAGGQLRRGHGGLPRRCARRQLGRSRLAVPLGGPPLRVGLRADEVDQRCRLGRLQREGGHLALEEVAGQVHRRGHPVRRRDRHARGVHPQAHPVVERGPAPVPLRGQGGEPHPPAVPGQGSGLDRPRPHGAVVAVPRHPVGAEGDDGVRAHVLDDRGHPLHGGGPVRGRAATVGVAQAVVLVDAQHLQAGGQLAPAGGGEAPPPGAVRADPPSSPSVAVTTTTRRPAARAWRTSPDER